MEGNSSKHSVLEVFSSVFFHVYIDARIGRFIGMVRSHAYMEVVIAEQVARALLPRSRGRVYIGCGCGLTLCGCRSILEKVVGSG